MKLLKRFMIKSPFGTNAHDNLINDYNFYKYPRSGAQADLVVDVISNKNYDLLIWQIACNLRDLDNLKTTSKTGAENFINRSFTNGKNFKHWIWW